MWKKLLLGLVGLILAFAAFVASRPGEFKIQRSIKVQAPPGVVYSFVYDFHNWARWSPWDKLDPAMKRTFAGAEKGQGAVYSWVGNDDVGEGRMTIEKAVNARALEIKLEFLKPWSATNQTTFTFDKNGPNTEVTWTMTGTNDFMGKAFSLFMDMDAMVGGDFERGLDAMKKAAEGEIKRQAEEQAAREAKLEAELSRVAQTAAAQAAAAATAAAP